MVFLVANYRVSGWDERDTQRLPGPFGHTELESTAGPDGWYGVQVSDGELRQPGQEIMRKLSGNPLYPSSRPT